METDKPRKMTVTDLTQELNALSLLASFCGITISWMCTSGIFQSADDHGLKGFMLEARAACNSVISDYDKDLRSLLDVSAESEADNADNRQQELLFY